jgi:hypothetical protein
MMIKLSHKEHQRYFFITLLIITITSQLSMGSDLWRPTSAPARVSVEPEGGIMQVRHRYKVEIWIEDVVDLYGADVQIGFNPSEFEIIDANPSLPGVQLQPGYDFLSPDFLIKNVADNQAGTIWYAASQSGDIHPNPVSGSGVLYSFEVRVLDDGEGELTITYKKLSNKDGEEIPADIFGASYQLSFGEDQYLPFLLSGRTFH